MLLRSASTPILNSWKPQRHVSPSPSSSSSSSPEQEIFHQIQNSPRRSITLMASSAISEDNSVKKIARALSESDLKQLSVIKKKQSLNSNVIINEITLEEEREEEEEEKKIVSSQSDLGLGLGLEIGLMFNEVCDVGVVRDDGVAVLVDDGFGVGDGGGGKTCGGGDGRNGGGGEESTDLYYQKMIEANPENSLLLSNYARFLKEVRRDIVKAEEYYGRAILANPNDGNSLSMYADLIWQSHKDASRAETYFDQAVKASPDDCYVLASYARFLWDTEEDEEETEIRKEDKVTRPSPMIKFHEVPPPRPPLAAGS